MLDERDSDAVPEDNGADVACEGAELHTTPERGAAARAGGCMELISTPWRCWSV
jgi:hypothetical protein